MYIRVERDSSLFKLLQQFIEAYNRRTDVMEASTDLSIQRRIDELTSRVDTQAKTLDTAVDKATKET